MQYWQHRVEAWLAVPLCWPSIHLELLSGKNTYAHTHNTHIHNRHLYITHTHTHLTCTHRSPESVESHWRACVHFSTHSLRPGTLSHITTPRCPTSGHSTVAGNCSQNCSPGQVLGTVGTMRPRHPHPQTRDPGLPSSSSCPLCTPGRAVLMHVDLDPAPGL